MLVDVYIFTTKPFEAGYTCGCFGKGTRCHLEQWVSYRRTDTGGWGQGSLVATVMSVDVKRLKVYLLQCTYVRKKVRRINKSAN